MKVSTKGRYALRLMIDLAQQDTGTYITLKDISKRQDVSVKYLEQIVSQLCKVGYLKSVRGPKGGYRLAKDPKNYTIGEILRITEGNLAPVACLEDDVNQCPRAGSCDTVGFWSGLYDMINDYIDKFTLYDLAKK